MRKAITVSVACFIGMGVSARAADLESGSLKDAPVAYGPAHSWAGLYVGGSAGFAKGDLSETRETLETAGGLTRTYVAERSGDFDGAVYGAHIGYNLQFGNIVLGLEAGINGTDIDSCGGSCGGAIEVNTKLDSYNTAVARLGYAEGSWLLYGFGGVAWAKADMAAEDNFPRLDLGPLVPAQEFNIHGGAANYVGWTAGFGVEYALSDRLSVRAEYSHVDLGEETISLGSKSDVIYTQEFSDTVGVKFDTVKIGASYKLFSPERGIDPIK